MLATDGSPVESHAVEEQPTVPRLTLLLLAVGVEGTGERAAAAEESGRARQESAARSARQVRRDGGVQSVHGGANQTCT